MNTVIIVNLNGVAYHIEQPGYEALRQYLEAARQALKDNPDREEIMKDLEQAIADKCAHFLQAHKNVVTQSDMESVLKEMGPVQGGAAPTGTEDPAAAQSHEPHAEGHTPGTKRLYQIREGAMISGVCNGLAAYFGTDVTLVRIAFVVLVFLTGGFWLLAYLIMMLVVPFANTDEERAAAGGAPFTAQGVIDRAKRHYDQFKNDKEWRRHWRQQRREWRKRWTDNAYWWGHNLQQNVYVVSQHRGYFAQVFLGLFTLFLSLLSIALFVLLLAGIVTLSSTGQVFGVQVANYMPLWVGILVLCLMYGALTSPLHHARRALYWSKDGHPWQAAWDGMLWFAVLIIVALVAYKHSAQVRDFLQHLPANLNMAWTAITDSFHHAAAPASPAAPASAATAASAASAASAVAGDFD